LQTTDHALCAINRDMDLRALHLSNNQEGGNVGNPMNSDDLHALELPLRAIAALRDTSNSAGKRWGMRTELTLLGNLDHRNQFASGFALLPALPRSTSFVCPF
jgi:hypothetical protein